MRLLGLVGGLAVEEDVASHAKDPMAWAQAIAHVQCWRKLQSGASVADHQGCDGDLQPVQESGLREGRDRDATSLDEGYQESPLPEAT